MFSFRFVELLKNFTMINLSLPKYNDHTVPFTSPTLLQVALFEIWLVAASMLLFRWLKGNNQTTSPINGTVKDTSLAASNVNNNAGSETKIDIQESEQKRTNGGKSEDNGTREDSKEGVKLFSAVKPPPTFDQFLKYTVMLGCILYYFYLCDYKKIFPTEPKEYNRDTFLFLVFLLFLVSSAFTIKQCPDKILHRDITEEWKGWMQVMFVWYHYFQATEWYNWIRMYIAAYVWMTGFGNFSFFWIKKDFSPFRALKMLFRLNFLVLLICATVSNEYMLYYICAMHTHWFLSVYACMGILPSWNADRVKMCIKFAVYAICNFIIFDIPGVADVIFSPLYLLLGINDGHDSVMHEWSFRCGLDHWVAFIGMLCAYNYPHYENFITRLEQNGNKTKEHITKAILLIVSLVAYGSWHFTILPMEKYTYNRYHPYTSFIPILAFIVVRNLYPVMRTHYISMFAWLGKITLETYLSQLHIYLQSNAKALIIYIPGYSLLNFSLSTIIYLSLSYSLFNLTTEFSAYLLPKDYKTIGKNIVYIVFSLGIAMVAAVPFRAILMV